MPQTTNGKNPMPTATQIASIRTYILNGWNVLQRSKRDIATAAVDPKFSPLPDGRWPVYVSSADDSQAIMGELKQAMTPEDFAKISLETLPEDRNVKHHGLLYLPFPYVVPGGRFNEMYGWDSYFILLGLLRDKQTKLAKYMVDNFIYQVEHYGCVLNANRTYYLTRSQPPFLAPMVQAVYQVTKDKEWLKRCLPALTLYYDFWIKREHLTSSTGLSRYWDFGEGAADEVLFSERDAEGKTHYDRVKEFFRANGNILDYDISRFYDRERDELTPAFFKGDRSMRESGFDPSNRFGPFNTDCVSYNPVCLNSLLYITEQCMAEISRELGDIGSVGLWDGRKYDRATKIRELMWDKRDGLFYDYNIETKSVRRYPFLTTFYPLWAGVATREQAAQVVKNLPLFERDGGLMSSTTVTGCQWDSPYGWAPLHFIAIEGLRRYGYNTEARRIAEKFLATVVNDFMLHNGIVEKYDVVTGRSDVAADIKFGYSSNEIGFGWTNAIVLEILTFLGL